MAYYYYNDYMRGPAWAPRKPARSREPQRRRPAGGGATLTHDPRHANTTFEYEDLGTMSDLELPSFQRGGLSRTSLPIVRSASTSLERPLGLVFLVHGSQTKKSLLPNELTSLDTVRALFVRSFPDCLSMELMEMPRKKIYLLDPATNIYFQLEDLGEIKDRSVLKLHETDDDIPQRVRERPEVRGRTVQVPLSRPQSRQENSEYVKSHSLPYQANPTYGDPQEWRADADQRSRSRTPEPMERPRSLSAGAASRQRYSHSPERFAVPDRNAGGGSLNPIPENRQVNPGYREPQSNFYETIGPHSPNSNYSRGGYPQSHYDGQNPYAIYAAPQQQAYIARSTRAPQTMVHPQRAVAPSPGDTRNGTRGGNHPSSSSRHHPAFVQGPVSPQQQPQQTNEPIYQRSQSYHRSPTAERGADYTRSLSTTPSEDHHTKNRIEKMEQQLASLTAWVHYQKADPAPPVPRKDSINGSRSLGSTASDSSDTFPASSASKQSEEIKPSISSPIAPTNHVVPAKGLSDIPDGQRPLPANASGSKSSSSSSSSSTSSAPVPTEISGQMAKLKSDLHVLKRQAQLNMEAMREEFLRASSSIKNIISTIPGAENQMNFHKRVEATKCKTAYISDKVMVDQELSDLESSVEELRNDIINHQCRVQMTDVEGMALLLSNITKNLADLKSQFPEVHEKMKDVMNREMQVVVAEENFLKEEPSKIEKSLQRCKKLTGTLYTLKRLASVQDHRPPTIPSIASNTAAASSTAEVDPKKTLLENIRALVPDHDRRVQEMEATEAARVRKKKISSQQEALKFGKSLEMASKTLKPCSKDDLRECDGTATPDSERGHPECRVQQEAPEVSSTQGPLSSQPYSQTSAQEASSPSSFSSSSISAGPSLSSSSSSSSSSSVSSLSSATSSTQVTYTSSTAAPVIAATIKPLSSFPTSLASSSIKPADKPTATVSAMTSTSSEIPRSVTSSLPCKSSPNDQLPPPPPSLMSAPIPTTDRPTSQSQADAGPASHVAGTATEMPTKSDSSVSTFTSEPLHQTVKPPVFMKPQRKFSPTKTSRTAPLVETECFDINVKDRPKSANVPAGSAKPPVVTKSHSVDISLSKTSKPLMSTDANGNVNGLKDTEDKGKPYRKAARSAFSSSWVSPPSSPTAVSPKSTPGAPSSLPPTAQITSEGTINLVLSGVASPMSPTNPGTFTITMPKDITTDSVSNMMTPPPAPTSKSPNSATSPAVAGAVVKQDGDSGNKQKKVPPPPPPRKGSRPTSMTNLPAINGGEQEGEAPQFVGGILGQHALSGGPLSSTPKPASQQRALSTFEKDIASGLYANLNRPDLQNQSSTPQQMLDKASNQAGNTAAPQPLPTEVPAPLVSTTCVDRNERGSSSESNSSSNSGTSSMGSQQSVVNVARSASVTMRNANKPKPEPPRRHSSLLSKSPVTPPDTRVHSRRKTLNGVDL